MLSGKSVTADMTNSQNFSPISYKSYESFNDLFSLEAILELFGFDEDKNEIFLLQMQDFLFTKSSPIIKNLEIFDLLGLHNNDKLFNLFNDYRFFSVSDLQNSQLLSINKILINNIETGGIEFAESTPALKLAYPNFYDVIVDYELAVMEDDGSMMDDLSTPDTKLHYPEPFIASPSFVHEDL
jgi:hypothetical protein